MNVQTTKRLTAVLKALSELTTTDLDHVSFEHVSALRKELNGVLGRQLSPELESEIRGTFTRDEIRYIQAGKVIEVIKSMRARVHGLELRDAKETIEKYAHDIKTTTNFANI